MNKSGTNELPGETQNKVKNISPGSDSFFDIFCLVGSLLLTLHDFDNSA